MPAEDLTHSVLVWISLNLTGSTGLLTLELPLGSESLLPHPLLISKSRTTSKFFMAQNLYDQEEFFNQSIQLD